MKTTTKPAAPTTAPAPAIPLSPRQIALKKLYRVLLIGGGLVLILTLGTILPLWGRFFPSNSLGNFFGEDKPMREPKLNPNKPPGEAPEGMVWIPGGEFYMGCDLVDPRENPIFEDAFDVHLVHVDGFWMDKYEVTNEQYAAFVKATKYVTVAERKPKAEEFPDVPREKLKPFSIVFKKPGPNDEYDLRTHQGWWDMKYGASWKHPEGPDSNLLGREKYPVVHVCYYDAVAYCLWAKKRLPTEAEWEFAARGGLDRKKFSWGDELLPNGKWMANVWQGDFPRENTKEDGFEGLAPVGSFPANAYGLHDMAGNAWEWCADWYQPDAYNELTFHKKPAAKDNVERNPKGPDSSYDREEPNSRKRVQRGGSFLCADNYCVRYFVGARGKGEINSASVHIGFRCVQDAK